MMMGGPLGVDGVLRNGKSEVNKKHTTAGIRWSSPTQLLICRLVA
jgi:hypothetical protein